ncbi:hypothetical protein [Methanolobus halotolerans]|uniref:Uncharacterized protein n=1 Tax=Methanolobus halotolerans TaxID=2052935 RepID=A0A4E0PUR1_9EURY|nr:hypothetical protein [Methanolobus halotolerans]TGC07237.1 hypothetical protein CUN85_11865 [Methanolobus halotolerans]
MVGLFKREKESRKISEKERVHLAEVSYKLGFEVGYHRHSEIGWVQEQLNKLYGFAEEYELRDFARENYMRGKEEGSKTKERDTKSGMFKGMGKENKAESDKSSGFTTERPVQAASFSKSESGFTSQRTSLENSSAAIQQPTLTDLPDSVQLTKAVEMPSVLEGSKHLLPKKK